MAKRKINFKLKLNISAFEVTSREMSQGRIKSITGIFHNPVSPRYNPGLRTWK